MGWNTSQARPTMDATGAWGPTSISHSDWVPPFEPVNIKVLDTLRILTLSAFQLSAAIKAKTKVQRPPAPAKPMTCVKNTENMDKPNNMRVLLTTRSSCGEQNCLSIYSLILQTHVTQPSPGLCWGTSKGTDPRSAQLQCHLPPPVDPSVHSSTWNLQSKQHGDGNHWEPARESSLELTSGERDSQASGEACDGQNVIKTASSHQQRGDSLTTEESCQKEGVEKSYLEKQKEFVMEDRRGSWVPVVLKQSHTPTISVNDQKKKDWTLNVSYCFCPLDDGSGLWGCGFFFHDKVRCLRWSYLWHVLVVAPPTRQR